MVTSSLWRPTTMHYTGWTEWRKRMADWLGGVWHCRLTVSLCNTKGDVTMLMSMDCLISHSDLAQNGLFLSSRREGGGVMHWTSNLAMYACVMFIVWGFHYVVYVARHHMFTLSSSHSSLLFSTVNFSVKRVQLGMRMAHSCASATWQGTQFSLIIRGKKRVHCFPLFIRGK